MKVLKVKLLMRVESSWILHRHWLHKELHLIIEFNLTPASLEFRHDIEVIDWHHRNISRVSLLRDKRLTSCVHVESVLLV